MNNDNQMNMMADAARMINYKLHAEQLNIPLVNEFQVENDGNP